MLATSAAVQTSLADPPGGSPLLAAVAWVQGTLLGTIATAIAVIAVASVGLMMFSGRLPARRGLFVVLGCFILFGAPAIAAGIQAFLAGGDTQAAYQPRPVPPPPAAPAPPPNPPANRDPYAGAAVPAR
jgi:type IV secretion system protein VirB2